MAGGVPCPPASAPRAPTRTGTCRHKRRPPARAHGLIPSHSQLLPAHSETPGDFPGSSPQKKKKVLSPWAGRPCPTGPGQSWSPRSALHQINQQSSVCTSAEVVLALLVHSQQRVLPVPSAPALIRLRTPCLLQNFLLNQPGRKMEF